MFSNDEVTAYRMRRKRSGIRQYLRNLEIMDYRLVVSVVFLLMFGIIMVYSATNADHKALLKQLAVGLFGLFVMLVVSYIDYRVWVRHAGLIFWLSFFSMFLVLVPHLGHTGNGAARWIYLGGLSVQPSEFMKPAIILLMAYMLPYLKEKLRYIRAGAIVFAPSVLAALVIVLVTSNLSTAVIVLGIAALLFFAAYPDKKIWLIVGLVLILCAVFAACYYFFQILPDLAAARASGNISGNYRAMRILAWLYPDEFPNDSMQSRYALYALGSGGLLGRGLGHGTMKYYLPEASNDFIFAVIGEELGLVGCCMIIFLFIYQIWRIMVLAQHAGSPEGTLTAFGIGVHIALQVIFNIAVNISLLPNTGISLPYISSGGSAILIQLFEIGIVLNISKQIPGRKVLVQEPAADDLPLHYGRRGRR